MRTYNIQLASSNPLNTTFTSSPQQTYQMQGYSIQAVFTGTPTGTFKLQASSDPFLNTSAFQNPVNWSDIPYSFYTVSAAGNFTWNVFEVQYNFVRLVYTDASGGTSDAILTSAILNAKGLAR